MKHPYSTNFREGFTLIELCVVIATIGILAVMLAPALGQGKTRSRVMDCLNNQKQLAMAAKIYADDNQDNWVPNQPGQSVIWAGGTMSWNSANSDNTNAAKLADSAFSVMASYVRNPVIYHCPGDYSYVPDEGSRVRSVSMNEAVGTVGVNVGQLIAGSAVNGQWLVGNNIGISRQSTWRTYGKTSSMINPTPATLWIFADEHPDSINDSSFAVDMADTGVRARIIDFPASFHDGAGGFSFADGHAEIHRWIGSNIKLPVVIGGFSGGNNAPSQIAGDSAPDMQWLQSHTSAHM